MVAPSFADDRTPAAANTDNVTNARGEAVVFDRTPYVVNHTDNPDAILFDNGPLSTGATSKSGVAAPVGSTWSEVQNPLNDTTQSNTTAGASGGITTTARFRLADNFTVPVGATWTIDSIATFSYQTGSTPATSPFIALNAQIWSGGRPGDPGATVVGGDTTTNRLTTSVWSTYYRIFNSKYPPPGSATGTTRPVFKNVANMGGVVLGPGTYWLDWQTQITASAGHFAPSVTLVGQRGNAAWNARQFTAAGWADFVDAGNPATAPDSAQDFPFILYGTAPSAGGIVTVTRRPSLSIPDNIPAGVFDTLTVSGVPGGTVVKRISVSIDSLPHTWVGDFRMTLTHAGVTRTLMNRPGTGANGSSGDNFFGTVLVDSAARRIDSIATTGTPPNGPPYTGYFRPDSGGAPSIVPSSLAPFNGADPNGQWILFLSDNAAADVGILQKWSLIIEYGAPTGVGNPQELPSGFTLGQNYPNPFNPATTIQFGLPVAANVTVKIYNLLGQEVATLVDEFKNAGTFQAVWNGRNSSGTNVASGMYFYSLIAKSADGKSTFTNIKKMMLLK